MYIILPASLTHKSTLNLSLQTNYQKIRLKCFKTETENTTKVYTEYRAVDKNGTQHVHNNHVSHKMT